MQHPTGPPPTRMPTDEEAEDEPEDDQGDDENHLGQESLGKADSAVMKTCPHVAGVYIDVVKNTLLDPSLWSCRECNHTESCWACLSCGYVGCSRFQESHGLLHYEATHHPIVFEINTKYCHCYKCDAYLDNDNKRGDIAALRLLVEQLQTHTICESRTRSGRLLRRSSSVKMHPRDYTSDDRVSTAVKHWQLNTIVRAFSQWRWFVDAQKAAESDDEHPLPPAPGLSLFQPPTTSEGAQDAGTKEYDDDDEEEDADGRSGEPSEEESEDSNDDAKTSNKRKRGDDKEVEHELERDAKEEQEPHSGEADREGEAEKKQNNDKEGMLHQEEEVVGEGDAPAPVFATPPPPQRRAKRRKGLLADLDMDGPSLRPQAIFLSPVARRNLVPGQTGLRNLGNTCFMNAVLQALSNTLQFRNYFVADFLPKDKKGKLWRRKTIDCLKQITTQQPPVLGEISISAEIHNIFRVVWSGRWAVVTPFALLDALWKFVPRFRNYQQQDAQEFLVYLLDKLHDELTSLNGGVVASPSGQKRQGESIISKTFNGELLSQVTCSACGNVSSRREPYLDLLLDIPIQHAGGSRSTRGNRKTNVPSCSLYDCLDSFTWPEKLTGYYCEKCKSNQNASKRLAIQTLPDVLCVVLKRFCWTTTSRAKVDTKVLFPLIGLDLSAFCTEERENAIFDLSSVVIHHGSGPSAGHYTAFCYHTEQGTWLHFNDCRVSVSSPQEAASAQAYMLFYQRRSASDSKIPIPAIVPASDALAGESDEVEAESDDNDNDNHNNSSSKRKQRRGTKKSKETDGEEEGVDDGDGDAKEAAGERKQRGSAKRRRVDEADEKKQQRRDERDLEELKRDELVVALRKRGLRTTGAKAVLLKRLQDAIRHDDDDDPDDDDGDDGDDDREQEKPRPVPGVTKRRLAKRTNRGTTNK